MISSLIKWDHSDDWYVYKMREKIASGDRTVDVSLADEDFEFIAGHVIDGRCLFPATGYLALVWETIGLMNGEDYSDLSVVFEDVKFLRATNVPKEGTVQLSIINQKGYMIHIKLLIFCSINNSCHSILFSKNLREEVDCIVT